MTFWPWLVFIAAAALEVAGDALVRHGLRGNGWAFIAAGCLALSGYGLVVNVVRWDFSRLLGVYVGVFALVSVLTGRIMLKEEIPVSTWLGLGLILVGGLVIQLGRTPR
jgi:small multidrug resistance family-3 protein